MELQGMHLGAHLNYYYIMSDVRIEELLPLRSFDQNAEEGKERFNTSFVAVIVASLASLCFGYSIGYSSPTELNIKNSIANSTSQHLIWFASLLGVGAFIGSILSGFCIEKCGRKKTIMMTVLFYTPGWFLISYSAKSFFYLFIGRILTGVGAGMSSLAVPIYIAEVSSVQFRGRLGVVNQIGITFGIFLAFWIGYSVNYSFTAEIAAALALIMAFLMFFMPESPRWLLAHKQRFKAFKALLWLRGRSHDVEGECCEIEINLEQQPLAALNDFKTPGLFRPLIIGSLLMVFQQLCGINAMLFFAEQIFLSARVPDNKKIVLLVALAQVFMTSLTYFIVDRFGRRKLLMVGSISMFLCTFILGIYFNIEIVGNKTPNHEISWLAILCFVVYIINYSLGWGPLPWLLMSEIFPPRARGFASSIVTCVNWTFVFIVTFSFNASVGLIKEYGTLWLYSGFCFISFLFVFYFVPETSGKTLEDIEHYYQIYYGFRNHLK